MREAKGKNERGGLENERPGRCFARIGGCTLSVDLGRQGQPYLGATVYSLVGIVPRNARATAALAPRPLIAGC